MLDFFNEDIFLVESDIVVIPVTTKGNIHIHYLDGIKRYFPDFKNEFKTYKLGDVTIESHKIKHSIKHIAYVCCIEENNGSYASLRKIGKNLALIGRELKTNCIVVSPILGIGSGKLDPFFSRNIMFNAFYEEEAHTSCKLVFCTLDKEVFDSFEGRFLDLDTPSGQLVIEAEKPYIFQNELITELQYETDFYYELAEKKLHEFLDFKASKGFFQKIRQEFKTLGIPFKDYYKRSHENPEVNQFVTLCGQLIAYIDYRAYKKNIWNQYKDKRVLARSAVRQKDWFVNLLKYKETGALKSLSSSIKNAVKYLDDPTRNMTMLSEAHRFKVFNELLSKGGSISKTTEIVLDTFKKLGFGCKNQKNYGALCSRILYLPKIKQVWFDDSLGREGNDNIIDEGRGDSDISIASRLIEDCLNQKLPSLDLGNCGISDLSILPELFECVHLERLILSNEWPKYINGKWKKNFSSNKGKRNHLKFLPEEIKQLKDLKELICGGDWNDEKRKWNRWDISSLSSISDLSKLEVLNLSNNRLRNVKGLSKLKNLKVLELNNNEIETIEDLSGLVELNIFMLSNNHIKDVTFLRNLIFIKTLDLHNNIIDDLRPLEKIISIIGVVNNKWKVGTISIAKNPLEQPPMEIVNIGKEAVLRNISDVRLGGFRINEDIKVILVGNSEVGKSTLLKYLDNENKLDEIHPTTLWMDEKIISSKYKIKSSGVRCVLHVFDFGGHDYYHDTHHLFYSTNTVYLLLWEEKTNNLELRKCLQENKLGELVEIETQDYPVRYWLESVKYYIKDIEADNFEFEVHRENTYNSSVLLLQNKVKDVTRIYPLNNEKIWKNYPFIYENINISIKEPRRNLKHFDAIFEEMLNCMKIVGAKLPTYYFKIKDSLQKYSGKPVIEINEFQKYCNNILSDPLDLEQTLILTKYLKQIGLLLFTESSKGINVYIDKKWVIESIHKILLNLGKRNGEFERKYIESSLDKSNSIDVDNILEMMIDFKMIFKHPYENKYIAPLYLPRMPEAKVKLFLNESIKPYRRFEYSGFIQKNVVLSIFQRYSTLISTEKEALTGDTFYYWKDGLIIKRPGTTEIVMIKFNLGNQEGNARIDIYDISNHGEKATFIIEVIQYIKEVNKGFEIEEMVTVNGKEFISLEVLNKNAESGKLVFTEKKMTDFIYPKNEEKFYNLKDYKKFMTESIRRKKVAISYSKKDVAHVHTLIRFLKPLVDAELIEQPWYCTYLLPADEWEFKIKGKFDEADIVIFMISEYFYSTDYIVKYEIPNAIDRYNDGESVKIVPIVLEFYDWGRKGKYNLQQFSALPYQAKPISDFKNPKVAWSTITTSLKMMIEKELDPGKVDIISRELQEIYERQVKGSLDNNSI
jgi:internalin A